jgi:hypothetical protein
MAIYKYMDQDQGSQNPSDGQQQEADTQAPSSA